MPPTSQLIPPGTPSPQPTEEMHPLDKIILQILQQTQTAPIQPPPIEQFGVGRKLALAFASLDPQYRKERIDPLIQQRQAAAQFNPELERLKLLHGMIGPLGPVLSSMQRTEAAQPKQYPTITVGEAPGKTGIYERRPTGLTRLAPGPYGEEPTGNVVMGTDSHGNSVLIDKRTGKATPVTAPTGGPLTKPPNIEQEQFKRSSAVLKLRIKQAREMIETGGTRLSRIPQAIVSHDPTGIFSGSNYAASASTYNSFINEIGSLTRTLYGAQGVRSYAEIVRLINTMPPWTSGQERISKQFGALEQAVGVADSEMKQMRPDLFAEEAAKEGPQAGKRIRRSNFNQLPDAEKQRALRDGVKVID